MHMRLVTRKLKRNSDFCSLRCLECSLFIQNDFYSLIIELERKFRMQSLVCSAWDLITDERKTVRKTRPGIIWQESLLALEDEQAADITLLIFSKGIKAKNAHTAASDTRALFARWWRRDSSFACITQSENLFLIFWVKQKDMFDAIRI